MVIALIQASEREKIEWLHLRKNHSHSKKDSEGMSHNHDSTLPVVGNSVSFMCICFYDSGMIAFLSLPS